MSLETAEAGTGRTAAAVALTLLLLAAAASPVQGEALQGRDKERFLQRMEQVYSRTRTIQADFLEERRLEHLPRPLTFRGRIYLDLERDFLFLDYREPNSHIVQVRNGTALFYVRGQANADRIDLKNAPGAPPSGGLLDWSPRDFQGQVVPEKGGYRLIPSIPRDSGRSLWVLLDRDSLLLQSILIREPSGDRTDIRLEDVIVNEPLPKEVTGFSLPEGTTVHRLKQP